MGASYGKQKRANARRLGVGRFTALPHNVIHSEQYRALGFAARALLFDMAAQYNQKNNGKLVCCMKYLRPLGWTSKNTIARALNELKASGLLIQTRQGMMPPMSQAAWFALGWFGLDVMEGLDIDPRKYRHCQLIQINAIAPITGAARTITAPIAGAEARITAPISGAVEGKNGTPPAPITGEFIDLPSTHPIIDKHIDTEVAASAS
jgi:hypothetical protein